ncbi:MAG: bifunctional 5,10-methylenetetrahydrofolate dehydrogenase/5,10-methenyltetrahydrofolate cyclohydrolase [Solobacterium sp.]|nr:bifunctional 5,10-methylenetetrahydrofolate dehydrogenase/5,10-methenyltetrahydrofolate cyclohydrolase [Solobacterium sp.]
MGEIIYGTELSAERKQKLKERVDGIRAQGKRIPCLAVISAGSDAASASYMRGRQKACDEVGIMTKVIILPEGSRQADLENAIAECNDDSTVDGILLQLPLPKGMDEERALRLIDPAKDVDGQHPLNVARMHLNKPGFVPCTPRGIMAVLARMGAPLDGCQAVVVGRSSLVGSPVAKLLLNANATVTTCHSHTKNLAEVCRQADVLVVAIGKARMITADYVKEGAYVVDVGVNRTADGKLCGDVDFDGVFDKVAAITPVPRGVGPMTTCMLLENTMKAYEERQVW